MSNYPKYRNPWAILELEPTEDKKTIKRAYAKQIRKYHPEDEPEKFKEVQEAYETIMNSLENNGSSNQGVFDIDFGTVNTQTNFNVSYVQETPPPMEEDDLGLDEAFKHIDETNLNNTQLNTTEDVKEFYFKKFTEKIHYNLYYEDMASLLMDPKIIECLKERKYYDRAISFIVTELPGMNAITLTFLTDYFNKIENDFYKEQDIVGFTNIVNEYRQRKAKKQKTETRKRKSIPVILAILYCLMMMCFVIINNNKKENKTNEIKNPPHLTFDNNYNPLSDSELVSPFQNTSDESDEIDDMISSITISTVGDKTSLTLDSGSVYEADHIKPDVLGQIQILYNNDGTYYGVDIKNDIKYGPYNNIENFCVRDINFSQYYLVEKDGQSAVFSSEFVRLSEFVYPPVSQYSHDTHYIEKTEDGGFNFILK